MNDGGPSAAEVRGLLRTNRRRHHEASAGEIFTDIYIILFVVALYGWAAVHALRGYLGPSTAATTVPGTRFWIAGAAVLAAAGLSWIGLRALGPLLSTPATTAWVVSSPIDRRDWLLPRWRWLSLGSTAAAGLLCLAGAAATGAKAGSLAATAAAGALWGLAGCALAVITQTSLAADSTTRRRREGPAWAWWIGRIMIAAGADLALGVVAAQASTALLDPSVLAGLVENRRWRSIGQVVSQPLRPGRLSRRFPRLALVRVLLRAELRRPLRHPGALVVWAALLLVMYAVAVAVPSVAAGAHIVLGYLAATRLTGGLRAVSRSPGLRRLLGGRDAVLRLVHLVVPAAGTLVWYLATVPAVRPGLVGLDLLLVPGIIFAAYRAATRPPVRYGGPVAETPFGTLPVDLLRQVLRGPDVIAALVVLQLLLT
jgi:hypothetical protein